MSPLSALRRLLCGGQASLIGVRNPSQAKFGHLVGIASKWGPDFPRGKLRLAYQASAEAQAGQRDSGWKADLAFPPCPPQSPGCT